DDVLASEGVENYTVTLSGISNASIGDDVGLGTINDNDTTALFIADHAVNEGGTLVFALSLSAAAAFDVTFDYQTFDGTALVSDSDYVGIGLTSFTIPAGSLTSSLSVVTTHDLLFENDEAMSIT